MATTRVGIAPMKAAQIAKPGADFEIVEREIPKPAAGEVRIKVEACGVCHSDVFTKEGAWPGIQYPRVPWRPCRGSGYRRAGSPRNSIRKQVRLQGRGYRARLRKCGSRKKARSQRVRR